MGAELTAWVDKTGAILQEKGLLGLMLKAGPPVKNALDGLPLKPGRDLTRLVSVSAGRTLEAPNQLYPPEDEGQGDSRGHLI